MNLSVKHPHPTSVSDQSRSVALKAGGAYTMVAGFGRSGYGRVTHHEKRNQANAHANSDASAEPVLGETMQVLASRWLYEVSESARIAGKLIRGELIPHHTVGVVGQNNSPYIDVPMGMQSLVSWDNDSAEKIALFQAAAGVSGPLRSSRGCFSVAPRLLGHLNPRPRECFKPVSKPKGLA